MDVDIGLEAGGHVNTLRGISRINYSEGESRAGPASDSGQHRLFTSIFAACFSLQHVAGCCWLRRLGVLLLDCLDVREGLGQGE